MLLVWTVIHKTCCFNMKTTTFIAFVEIKSWILKPTKYHLSVGQLFSCLVGQKGIETDFQTALSNRAVALRPLLDIRGLSRTHTCPWQLYTMGFNAGLPGFLLCQPGWLDRSVSHWLVGWFAGWLVSSGGSAFRSCPIVPIPYRTKGWSGMLHSRHGHSPS